MSTLADRVARDPEPWKPQEGDTIEGVVVEIDTRESDYGDPYPVLALEDDDGGEHVVHAFHSVLAGEVRRKDPKPGDRVAIRFAGLKDKADHSGQFFHYRMAVERAERPAEPPVPATPVLPDLSSMLKDPLEPRPEDEQF